MLGTSQSQADSEGSAAVNDGGIPAPCEDLSGLDLLSCCIGVGFTGSNCDFAPCGDLSGLDLLSCCTEVDFRGSNCAGLEI